MKTIIYGMTLMALVYFTDDIFAQEYNFAVENSKDGKVVLSDFTGSLNLEGYNGNEIKIIGEESAQLPERAKGLKPVYGGGTDNTGLGVSIEKVGNKIIINCLLPFTKHRDFTIKIPDNLALEIESSCERSNDIHISNVNNEIDIKSCHSIELKNVTGPLVLNTIGGNIDITFKEISKDKAFSIVSISGEIDVTLPAKAAVSLDMKSISGALYSDFDFPVDNKEMKRIGGSAVKYNLNGGGVDFQIESISGNVYLRKGK